MQDVNYLKVVTHQERRCTFHGISIRVARDIHYRPSTFRSRSVECEETMYADNALLGFTTKQRKNVLNPDDVQTRPTCLYQRTRHPRIRYPFRH